MSSTSGFIQRPLPAFAAKEQFSGAPETQFGMQMGIGNPAYSTPTTSYREDTSHKQIVLNTVVTTSIAITRTAGVEVICPPFELPDGLRGLAGSVTTFSSSAPQRLPENGTVRLQERSQSSYELTTGVFGTGAQLSGEYQGTPEGAQEILQWRNSILQSFVNGFNTARIKTITQQAYANAYAPSMNNGINTAANLAQLLAEERNLYGIAGIRPNSLATSIVNTAKRNPELDTVLMPDYFRDMMRDRISVTRVPYVQMAMEGGALFSQQVIDAENPTVAKEFESFVIDSQYLMVTAPVIYNPEAQTETQYLSSRFVIGEVYVPDENPSYDESNNKTFSMKDLEMAIYDEPADSRKLLKGPEMFRHCWIWDAEKERSISIENANNRGTFVEEPTHGLDVDDIRDLFYNEEMIAMAEGLQAGSVSLEEEYTVHGIPPPFPLCFQRQDTPAGVTIKQQEVSLPALMGDLDTVQLSDDNLDESLFVAANTIRLTGDLQDVDRLRREIESTPYDNESFAEMARINGMRSVQYNPDGNDDMYLFVGEETPEHRVNIPNLPGGKYKRLTEWKPNKMGGFDIKKDMKPLGMWSAAGLNSLAQSDHHLAARASSAISKLENIAAKIEKTFTNRNFVVDGRLTSPAFHIESRTQQLMDVIWGQRRPLFMADPSGVLRASQLSKKARTQLRHTVMYNGKEHTVELAGIDPLFDEKNGRPFVLMRKNIVFALPGSVKSTDGNVIKSKLRSAKLMTQLTNASPSRSDLSEGLAENLVVIAHTNEEDLTDEDKKILDIAVSIEDASDVRTIDGYLDALQELDAYERSNLSDAGIELKNRIKRATQYFEDSDTDQVKAANQIVAEIYGVIDNYADEAEENPIFANIPELYNLIGSSSDSKTLGISEEDRDRLTSLFSKLSNDDPSNIRSASSLYGGNKDYPSENSIYYRTPLMATSAIIEGAYLESRPWVLCADDKNHDNMYVPVGNAKDTIRLLNDYNLSIMVTNTTKNLLHILNHPDEVSTYGLYVRFGHDVMDSKMAMGPMMNMRLRKMRHQSSGDPLAIAAGVGFLMIEVHRVSILTEAITNGMLPPVEMVPWRLSMTHMMDSIVITQRNGQSCMLMYAPGKVLMGHDKTTDRIQMRASMPYDVAVIRPQNFYLMRAVKPRQYLGGCNSRIVSRLDDLDLPNEELRPAVIVTAVQRGFMTTRQFPIAFDNDLLAIIDTGASSGSILDPDPSVQAWPGAQYYMRIFREALLGNSRRTYSDVGVMSREELPPFHESGDDARNMICFRGDHNRHSKMTGEFSRAILGNGHRRPELNQHGARPYMNGETNILESRMSQQDMIPVK